MLINFLKKKVKNRGYGAAEIKNWGGGPMGEVEV